MRQARWYTQQLRQLPFYFASVSAENSVVCGSGCSRPSHASLYPAQNVHSTICAIGSSQIYYGGVRLELPLQNKARTAEADQATSAIEVAKARYAAAQRDLRAEVASVTTAIETATKRLELAKQSVELARESVEAQSARFDAGRATSFDVVNAIQALREAEFRAVTLEVEIVQQKLALEQLVRGVASAPPAS